MAIQIYDRGDTIEIVRNGRSETVHKIGTAINQVNSTVEIHDAAGKKPEILCGEVDFPTTFTCEEFTVFLDNLINDRLSPVHKFGRNISVGTTTEDIWDGGGVWVPPTQARIHDIVSTSGSDDGSPLGIGAHTIKISGLDANFKLQSENLTLNGTANVPTVNTYIMIHRMKITAAGSTGSNVGTITATAQVDGTVTAQINPTNNQTLMAIYQIPAGKIGYMKSYFANMNRTGVSANVDLCLCSKPFGEVYQVKHNRGLMAAGSSSFQHIFDPSYGSDRGSNDPFGEKAIIKINAVSSVSGTDVSAGFDLKLVDS